MTEDKVTAMWEEDGDLLRLQEFFTYIRQDDELKERIKLKTLQKISDTGMTPAWEQEIPDRQDDRPVQVRKQNNGLIPRLAKLYKRLTGKNILKALAAAAALILAVYVGSTGVITGGHSFRVGSAANQATSAVTQYSKADGSVENSVAPAAPPATSTASPEAKGKAADQGVSQFSVDGQNAGVSDKAPLTATFSEAKSVTQAQAPNEAPAGAEAAAGMQQQKIIYVLEVSLKSDNVAAAMKTVEDKVMAAGGYVAESNQNNTEKEMTAYLSLRVPADKFQSFKGDLSQVGTITTEHLSSNDVSQQYYDVQTRLNSWEAQEKRYLAILEQAKTVEDILKIEDSLANVRREIDSLKGQIKYWDNHVQYSEIRLNIYPNTVSININDPWRPVSVATTVQAVKNAVLKTISFLWNAVNYLIVFIGYVIPVGILLGIAWLVFRMIRKKRKIKPDQKE